MDRSQMADDALDMLITLPNAEQSVANVHTLFANPHSNSLKNRE
jgi:hypothetical protein